MNNKNKSSQQSKLTDLFIRKGVTNSSPLPLETVASTVKTKKPIASKKKSRKPVVCSSLQSGEKAKPVTNSSLSPVETTTSIDTAVDEPVAEEITSRKSDTNSVEETVTFTDRSDKPVVNRISSRRGKLLFHLYIFFC